MDSYALGNIFIILRGVLTTMYLIIAAGLFAMLSNVLRNYGEQPATQIAYIIYGLMALVISVVGFIFKMGQSSFVIIGAVVSVVTLSVCILSFLVRSPAISKYYKIIGIEVLVLHASSLLSPMVIQSYVAATYQSFTAVQILMSVVFFIFALPIPITVMIMVSNIKRAKPLFEMPKEQY